MLFFEFVGLIFDGEGEGILGKKKRFSVVFKKYRDS